MPYTVSVELHHAEIRALLMNRARRIGNRVQNVARRRAPKDTGRLAASISVVVGAAPGFVYATIGTRLDYGMWTHEGTGIYGPRRRRITAKGGGFMRFQPGRSIGPVRGSGSFGRGPSRPNALVYARSVKGQPGTHYLVNALVSVVGSGGRIRRFGARR